MRTVFYELSLRETRLLSEAEPAPDCGAGNYDENDDDEDHHQQFDGGEGFFPSHNMLRRFSFLEEN